MVLLHSVEEDEDGDEDFDGVGVTTKGHVGESDVVVGGNLEGELLSSALLSSSSIMQMGTHMASGDPGKQRLAGQFDIGHGLQSH